MVKLSDQDRARAVGFIQAGRTVRNVAATFHVSPTTISNLIRRYNATGSVKDRPRSGRPRVTDAAEDRSILLMSLRKRTRSAPSIRAEVRRRRRNQQGLSIQTVRNRLRAGGLRARKPAKKPKLTDRHKRARLQWARQHVRWTHAQWSNVLFTDESRFLLFRNDGRMRVWRRPGERFSECCIQPRVQGGGGGVMVWGGISNRGKTDLVFVNGNMNAQRYIDQVLHPVVQPYVANNAANITLMDDNARPHRARIVNDFLRNHNITRMDPWPACSPDLNPIEHCWDEMKREIHSALQAGDRVGQLRQYVQNAWDNITPAFVNRLITSMRRRCHACIRARGGHTRY